MPLLICYFHVSSIVSLAEQRKRSLVRTLKTSVIWYMRCHEMVSPQRGFMLSVIADVVTSNTPREQVRVAVTGLTFVVLPEFSSDNQHCTAPLL